MEKIQKDTDEVKWKRYRKILIVNMKKKKKQISEEKGSQKKQDQREEKEEEKYAGLPDRDLKKNLGCGG